MKRAAALFFLLAAGGCYTQANDRPVPAAVVNDSCGGNATPESCTAAAGCEWRAVKSECPTDTACPGGICVTPDPCGQLADKAACEADARCAWSGLRLETASIDLCLVGQSCDTGGYCRARDASGGGCTCVQPIACPVNADCPAVECDCSGPTPGGGGGTCTCTCPACPPGEACPPCTCDCGGAGSCGGNTASGTGSGGTCTCACPACEPGASCPPCDCACGSGNVGVTSSAPKDPAPTPGDSTTGTADPCAGHGDTAACAADVANACRWIELGIVCVTTPCPSGACVQVKSVPGGGGCGCACPACAPGQSCPPCACDCCGAGTKVGGTGPTPVPA